MSIKVKGLFEDIGGAGRVTELRRKKLANASSRPDPRDPIRELADRLHPAEMKFRCVSVTDASPSAKTFRFESVDGHIPVFQCGQFVNFRLRIGESLLTRPYTISSAPYEARGEKPFFEITVRRNVPYLVPDYLFENVKPGDVLDGALPFGTFYWEPLRDTKNIVALAGGSGITPFYSMAKEIAHGKMRGCTLTILYGSVKSDDIVLKAELDKVCAECKAVKVVHVLSDDPTWQSEKGFITKELTRGLSLLSTRSLPARKRPYRCTAMCIPVRPSPWAATGAFTRRWTRSMRCWIYRTSTTASVRCPDTTRQRPRPSPMRA